jgi:hypothetical protein
MKRALIGLCASLLALAGAGMAGAATAAAAKTAPETASSPTACNSFRVAPSANLGTHHGEFKGISGSSSADLWAVGNIDDGASTLTEHWDGTRWARVAAPHPGLSSGLEAVTAAASNDVWAVGVWNDGTLDHALSVHWNGTSWTRLPVAGFLGLDGVAVVGPNDVWAVGEILAIRHWDGQTWSIISRPPFEDGDLHGVSGVSANDVWFAGAQEAEGAGDHTLMLHWDGIQVGQADLPVLAADNSELLAVSAIASDDVWAVGEQDVAGRTLTLIEHFDGTAWSVIASPSPGDTENELVDLTVRTADDIWAAGTWNTGGVELPPLVLHWDGVQWTQVPAQGPTGGDTIGTLEGITALPTGEVWVAGAHGVDDTSLLPLVERTRVC